MRRRILAILAAGMMLRDFDYTGINLSDVEDPNPLKPLEKFRFVFDDGSFLYEVTNNDSPVGLEIAEGLILSLWPKEVFLPEVNRTFARERERMLSEKELRFISQNFVAIAEAFQKWDDVELDIKATYASSCSWDGLSPEAFFIESMKSVELEDLAEINCHIFWYKVILT